MALSYFMVHGWNYVESPATSISLNTYLSIRAKRHRVPLALGRDGSKPEAHASRFTAAERTVARFSIR